MSSNNLPRLESNASSSNTLVGWLQIIIGGFIAVVCPVVLLMKIIFHKFSFFSRTSSVVLWLLMVGATWLIAAGFNRLTVNSVFQKLAVRLRGGEFTVEKLAEGLGLSVDRFLLDISRMNKRHYWSEMVVLDDAIVLIPFGEKPSSSNNYKILAGENMRFTSKVEGQMISQPVMIVFLVGLFFLTPLYKIIGLILGIVLSFPLHRATKYIMPKFTKIYYSNVPQYTSEKIEINLSGNEQADSLLGQGDTYLSQLLELQNTIADEHLHTRIKEIRIGTKQMLDKLQESPEKHKQVRQTLDYSLPTAINLFYKYRELEAQPVKGDNIQHAIAKIHEMSDLVATTFQRELDAMYQDQTLDIEVDIEVMRNLMQQEALDFEKYSKKAKDEVDTTSEQ